MSSNLARRGAIWWVRLVIPARLRELAGKREFSQSTRTHELHIAKLVAAVLLGGWRRQLLTLECRPMTSEILKLIGPATALQVGTHLGLLEAAASSGVSLDQLLRVAAGGQLQLFCRVPLIRGHVLRVQELELDNPALGASGGYVLPLPREMPDSAAEAVLSGLLSIPIKESAAIANAILIQGLKIVEVVAFQSPEGPEKLFIPDLVVQVKIESFEVLAAAVAAIHRHLREKVTPEQIKQAQELQKTRVQNVGVSAGKNAHKRFSEALEAYATTPSGISGRVVSLSEQKQKHNGCSLFIELVGDLLLSEITADRFREFREKLKTLPANSNHILKEYRRETVAATVQALIIGGVELQMMTDSAQRERMLWVDQMFRWLVAQEWLKENLLASVMREQTKTAADRKTERQVEAQRKAAGVGDESDDSDDREPFTQEELLLIFSQPHYITGNGEHVQGNGRWYPFEYWLPIIALHAGCRIKEVSQLRLRDIRQSEDGTWYFDINETTADKSLKNDNATRQIPVSPVLIDLGLIEYRTRLEVEGFKRLFPELTCAASDAKYAKEPVRKMSSTFKKLGMPRDGTKVFHCLRANFNDAMLRVPLANLPFDNPKLVVFAQMKIFGHMVEDVNGKHYTSAAMSEKLLFVSGIRYDLPVIAKFDIDFGIGQVRVAIGNKKGLRRGREDMGQLNSD